MTTFLAFVSFPQNFARLSVTKGSRVCSIRQASCTPDWEESRPLRDSELFSDSITMRMGPSTQEQHLNITRIVRRILLTEENSDRPPGTPQSAAPVNSFDPTCGAHLNSPISLFRLNCRLHELTDGKGGVGHEGLGRQISGSRDNFHRTCTGGNIRRMPSLHHYLPNRCETPCASSSRSWGGSSCRQKGAQRLLREEYGVYGPSFGDFCKAAQAHGLREKSRPLTFLPVWDWTDTSAPISRLESVLDWLGRRGSSECGGPRPADNHLSSQRFVRLAAERTSGFMKDAKTGPQEPKDSFGYASAMIGGDHLSHLRLHGLDPVSRHSACCKPAWTTFLAVVSSLFGL